MTPQVHQLQVNLPPELYAILQAKAQELGQSEEATIVTALQSWLDPQGLAALEKRLELLIDQRIAHLRSEFLGVKPDPTSPLPPLRALQVGDIVQVRESGSPYYLEKFKITRVGMIRAYVETREGECSFLKRDLRLID